jgi:hypothetical protein
MKPALKKERRLSVTARKRQSRPPFKTTPAPTVTLSRVQATLLLSFFLDLDDAAIETFWLHAERETHAPGHLSAEIARQVEKVRRWTAGPDDE